MCEVNFRAGKILFSSEKFVFRRSRSLWFSPAQRTVLVRTGLWLAGP